MKTTSGETQKIAKNCDFFLFGKLLEILILQYISRDPPCESSRLDDSEKMGLEKPHGEPLIGGVVK